MAKNRSKQVTKDLMTLQNRLNLLRVRTGTELRLSIAPKLRGLTPCVFARGTCVPVLTLCPPSPEQQEKGKADKKLDETRKRTEEIHSLKHRNLSKQRERSLVRGQSRCCCPPIHRDSRCHVAVPPLLPTAMFRLSNSRTLR